MCGDIGSDATREFEDTFHSDAARALLPKYLIGRLTVNDAAVAALFTRMVSAHVMLLNLNAGLYRAGCPQIT